MKSSTSLTNGLPGGNRKDQTLSMWLNTLAKLTQFQKELRCIEKKLPEDERVAVARHRVECKIVVFETFAERADSSSTFPAPIGVANKSICSLSNDVAPLTLIWSICGRRCFGLGPKFLDCYF